MWVSHFLWTSVLSVHRLKTGAWRMHIESPFALEVRRMETQLGSHSELLAKGWSWKLKSLVLGHSLLSIPFELFYRIGWSFPFLNPIFPDRTLMAARLHVSLKGEGVGPLNNKQHKFPFKHEAGIFPIWFLAFAHLLFNGDTII